MRVLTPDNQNGMLTHLRHDSFAHALGIRPASHSLFHSMKSGTEEVLA